MCIKLILNLSADILKVKLVDLAEMENAGVELLKFIDTHLTHPGANFGENNKTDFMRILEGFPFKTIDENATSAYNIEDVDEEYGPREYTREQLQASLDDEDNIVYTIVSMLRYAVNRYTNDVKTRNFDDDQPASAHHPDLNTLLNNIIAVFNAFS
jgi:hypothetical protein